MQDQDSVVSSGRRESVLSTNRVLRRTYLLLSCTLLCSAFSAWYSMVSNAPMLGIIPTLIGVYGLMFLTNRLSRSVWGIVSCFAFTGFMGYILGPTLNFYVHSIPNGGQLVMTALGATGVIFFALSGYTLASRKDFSFLGGFLFIGMMVAALAMIAGFFFQIPALQLAISAAFALLSSGIILYKTSQIIHGGERNFIMATITLYVAIYNIFVSLLQIFGASRS